MESSITRIVDAKSWLRVSLIRRVLTPRIVDMERCLLVESVESIFSDYVFEFEFKIEKITAIVQGTIDKQIIVKNITTHLIGLSSLHIADN
jgi:hypothetical protein